MATFVIKKDGTKEPFDIEKVKNSITAALTDAGVEEEKIKELSEKVLSSLAGFFDSQEEFSSSEIKEKILSELDNLEPSAADAWRKYDETKTVQESELPDVPDADE